MRTYLFACFLSFIIPVHIYADGGLSLYPKGARAEGMGTTSAILQDVWAAYNNQAALASLTRAAAGLHYENKFTMDELSTSAAAVAVPALTGTIGATIAHMGTSDYGENRLGLGYGKQLFKNFSIGAQVNYHLLTFGSGYPSLYAVTAEIGILGQPMENFWVGAHLFNPSSSKLSNSTEDPVPVMFKVGMGYSFANNLLLAAEVGQEQHQSLSTKLGAEYFLVDKFCLRLGTLFEPRTVFFGVGWKANHLALDFALKRHHALGYTPQLSLAYRF